MQCILMNFDDRTRVIHDANKKPVVLGIGAMKSADLDDATHKFLKRSMVNTNDALVLVPDGVRHPPEIIELMDILRDMDTAPYDEVLMRSSALIGADNIGGPRPSRQELRYKLRNVAALFANGNVLPTREAIRSTAAKIERDVQANRDRREPGAIDEDEEDRQLAVKREQEAKEKLDAQRLGQMAPRVKTERDKMDDALGIMGGTVDDLAGALNKAPDAGDAFDPAKARPEPVPKKKRPSRAKPAKPARTSRADKASPAPAKPAGKPTRIRG